MINLNGPIRDESLTPDRVTTLFNDKGELVDHSEQRNVRRDDLPLLLEHDADGARQEG